MDIIWRTGKIKGPALMKASLCPLNEPSVVWFRKFAGCIFAGMSFSTTELFLTSLPFDTARLFGQPSAQVSSYNNGVQPVQLLTLSSCDACDTAANTPRVVLVSTFSWAFRDRRIPAMFAARTSPKPPVFTDIGTNTTAGTARTHDGVIPSRGVSVAEDRTAIGHTQTFLDAFGSRPILKCVSSFVTPSEITWAV